MSESLTVRAIRQHNTAAHVFDLNCRREREALFSAIGWREIFIAVAETLGAAAVAVLGYYGISALLA